MDSFDPGSRPSGILAEKPGFNVGKFLGLTAALAVGAGLGAGAYYGVAASASTPIAEPKPAADPPAEAAVMAPDVGSAKPAGPKLDVPAVDEPSDPGALRLDVPDPWGLSAGEPAPAPAGGGGGGATQEF